MSECKYVGKNIEISLVRTLKTDGLNQGTFTFRFQPPMSLLRKYDFAQLFHFSCPTSTFRIEGWEYLDGNVTLTVDYLTDLEEQPVSVDFAFNQFYIRNPTVSLNFTVKSDNLPLIVIMDTTSTIILKYICLAVSCYALLLLVLGSWFIKMVGVEMVNTLQIIYYIQFTNNKYTDQFQRFLEMSMVGLSDVFLQKSEMGILLYWEYQKVPFSLRVAERSLLVIAIVLGVVGGVIAIGYARNQSGEEDRSNDMVCKILRKVYGNMLVPLSVTLLFPYVFLIDAFAFKEDGLADLYSVRVRALLILIVMFLMALVFCEEFRQLFRRNAETQPKRSQEESESCYIPVYLLYIFLSLLLILAWLRVGSSLCPYPLLLVGFLMLSWQMRTQPYSSRFANVCICLNVSLLLSFQLFLLLRKNWLIPAN
jgi:hypothetical protein